MNEYVLDASVVLKWFRSEGERHVEQARFLRAEFEAGQVLAFTPPLLFIEIINVAGRRWRFTSDDLEELAETLPRLGFELIEPDLRVLARWTAQAMTAYDSAYVAVAEQMGALLITDDEELSLAVPELISPLAQVCTE